MNLSIMIVRGIIYDIYFDIYVITYIFHVIFLFILSKMDVPQLCLISRIEQKHFFFYFIHFSESEFLTLVNKSDLLF